MGPMTRRELLGDRWLLLLQSPTVIQIPLPILHRIASTVAVQEELEDPAAFVGAWRRRHGG